MAHTAAIIAMNVATSTAYAHLTGGGDDDPADGRPDDHRHLHEPVVERDADRSRSGPTRAGTMAARVGRSTAEAPAATAAMR